MGSKAPTSLCTIEILMLSVSSSYSIGSLECVRTWVSGSFFPSISSICPKIISLSNSCFFIMMEDGSFFFQGISAILKQNIPTRGHRERVLLCFQDQQQSTLRIKEKSESKKDVDEYAHGMGIPESSACFN